MADVFDVRDDGISFDAGIKSARARSEALERVARALAAEGLLTAWRDERYAVAPSSAPPWFELERAAARSSASTRTPCTSTASSGAIMKY